MAIGVLALVLIAGLWIGYEETDDRADDLYLNLLEVDPTIAPTAVHPASSRMPDDAPVIGIKAGNRTRAYALSAFSHVRDHVLNDLIGGVALTVTHCPRNGCTKVFTDPGRGRPLAIASGGWAGKPGPEPTHESVLLLQVDGVRYFQDTGLALGGAGSIPYSQADFEQTTWGEWRRAHPDTDVVTGSSVGN